jgi:hypothetical protein
MSRLLSRRPSPAMIVATLALFVALGGSAYSAAKIGGRDIKTGAVGSRAIANNSIRSSDIRNGVVQSGDVKDDSLTNADIDNTTLRAASAATADKATSATSAGNASTLDGLNSTAFTRRSCTGQTGALKGVVTVAGSATFPSAFTPVAGYNCSGQPIDARRIGPGRYEVRFNGSPVTQAVATTVVPGLFADAMGITPESPGLFLVYIVEPGTPDTFTDRGFTMITP